MEEGSVQVDTGNLPTKPTAPSQTTVQDKGETETDVTEQGTSTEGTEQGEEGQEGQEGQPAFTEKGTKRDPNPESAVHQDLANARKLLKDYETVLKNPKYLTAYAKEMGLTLAEAKQEIEDKKDDVEEITADKLQTAGDLAKTLTEMRKGFKAEIAAQAKIIQDLQSDSKRTAATRQVEQVFTTLKTDMAATREKYPELDPKDPSYNPELEKEIGELYHELDAVDVNDPSKGYMGRVSIANIADRIMRAAGKGKERGSKEAQTVVTERNRGRVVTSGRGNTQEEPESKDPGTTIAQRIARATKTQQ